MVSALLTKCHIVGVNMRAYVSLLFDFCDMFCAYVVGGDMRLNVFRDGVFARHQPMQKDECLALNLRSLTQPHAVHD